MEWAWLHEVPTLDLPCTLALVPWGHPVGPIWTGHGASMQGQSRGYHIQHAPWIGPLCCTVNIPDQSHALHTAHAGPSLGAMLSTVSRACIGGVCYMWCPHWTGLAHWLWCAGIACGLLSRLAPEPVCRVDPLWMPRATCAPNCPSVLHAASMSLGPALCNTFSECQTSSSHHMQHMRLGLGPVCASCTT